MANEIIKIKREELGLSQTALGKIIGVSQQHIDRYEKGYPVPLDKVILISQKLGINKWDLLPPDFKPVETITINKIGFVEAGTWQEALQLPKDEWEEIPYPLSPSLKDKHIFALSVRGNSMNRIFPPDSTTLICCCIDDYPKEIENGDYVIAQRVSADGKYEATVKRFTRINDSTVILQPESTDDSFKPIIITDDNCEYQIKAIVIDYQTKLKDL